MQVIWRSDLGQGKHDPLEITHVVTKSGSQVSADLVIALELAYSPVDETAGLLEVIEEQMAAIDELSKQAEMAKNYADTHAASEDLTKDHRQLKEWADQFPHLVEDLCIALGFARNPVGPTGIPELDVIVSLAR